MLKKNEFVVLFTFSWGVCAFLTLGIVTFPVFLSQCDFVICDFLIFFRSVILNSRLSPLFFRGVNLAEIPPPPPGPLTQEGDWPSTTCGVTTSQALVFPLSHHCPSKRNHKNGTGEVQAFGGRATVPERLTESQPRTPGGGGEVARLDSYLYSYLGPQDVIHTYSVFFGGHLHPTRRVQYAKFSFN